MLLFTLSMSACSTYKITLNLKNVPVVHGPKYLTQPDGLKFSLEYPVTLERSSKFIIIC